MDAVKFLNELTRMCKNHTVCNKCDHSCQLYEIEFNIENNGEIGLFNVMRTNPNKLVDIVEQWSKEHPKKTRLEDFKEKYPNANTEEYFYDNVCCEHLGYLNKCPHDYDVDACKDCWHEPVD